MKVAAPAAPGSGVFMQRMRSWMTRCWCSGRGRFCGGRSSVVQCINSTSFFIQIHCCYEDMALGANLIYMIISVSRGYVIAFLTLLQHLMLLHVKPQCHYCNHHSTTCFDGTETVIIKMRRSIDDDYLPHLLFTIAQIQFGWKINWCNSLRIAQFVKRVTKTPAIRKCKNTFKNNDLYNEACRRRKFTVSSNGKLERQNLGVLRNKFRMV